VSTIDPKDEYQNKQHGSPHQEIAGKQTRN
jgi:hypothetical protein